MSSEKMGQFIAELRKSRQMTQKELAEKLNITDKAVSKWERGLSYPDICLLLLLAETLGVTPGELLNCERNPSAETGTAANVNTNATIENVLQYADEEVKTKTRSTRKRAILASMGIIMLFMGLPFFVYPAVARWRNVHTQLVIAQAYNAEVARLQQEYIDGHFRRAEEHNAALRSLSPSESLLVGQLAVYPEDYFSILNVGGMMGRIEIPKINVDLPIFHGSGNRALDRGAGHLEGTAFPIGEYGDHPVIVAHSGLVNARMFTDIEGNIDIGDIFYVTVLDRRMAYQVDDIRIISPHDVEALRPIPGADVVTLMTQTPYRVNTHRLLVRGTRVPYAAYFAGEVE